MMKSDIKKLIGTDLSLPSPPAVAVQILNAVQKNESGMKELSDIIATDPALTGKMLKVANSGFYALTSEVTNIDRALAVLGTNIIKNIALSFVFATDFRGQYNDDFDFDGYWRSSVTAAVSAELLIQQLGIRDEDIFVTALLHNIGMLVMAQQKRSEYTQLIKETTMTPEPLTRAEQELFRFDHQQVGSVTVEDWGLPLHIAEPIAYHHNPESAAEEFKATAYLLHFADRLAEIYTENDSAEKVRLLQDDLAQHYSFSPEQLRTLLDLIVEKSISILKTFEIDPGDMKPYSQMLQEANEELGRLNLSYEQLVIELKEAKEKSERLAKELNDANLRLKDLVNTDGLTGLYNHRYFQDQLKKELERSARYKAPVSLILFDIDHFKKVNDSYGHPAGDQVLINIAKVISQTIRPSDILARHGGEEFAVILPETNISGVKVFAARLRRCVEGLVTRYDAEQIKVTISLGGTTFDPGQTDVAQDLLFKTADRGLYMSKDNGRNQVTILATENAPNPGYKKTG